MFKKKSKLKVLICSARLVKKINRSQTIFEKYPDWIDIQYPDISVAFYGYNVCKKLGDLVYRHNIINWNTRVSDES